MTAVISILIFLLLCLVIFSTLQLYSMYRTHQMDQIVYTSVEPDYWPTKEWLTSSPEKQGVSSDKLLDMISFYKEKRNKNEDLLIDSITIIRNERIIADLYFNPLWTSSRQWTLS